MKLIKISYIISLVLIFQPSISCWGMDEEEREVINICQPSTPMPFKLGFEFQESSHLCPWAKFNRGIQKKPLFFVADIESRRKLWEVVIDGEDIEFVLEPFSHAEYNLLEKSITSVLIASEPLTQQDFNRADLEKALTNLQKFIGKNSFEVKVAAGLRNSKNPQLENSFEIWKEWLQSNKQYQETSDVEFSELWNQEVEVSIDHNRMFALAKISPADSITFKNWLSEVNQPILNQGFLIEENVQYFPHVENKPIQKRQELKFQPQATIQYPLEYSIPLLFSLFKFKIGSPIITKLLHALPFLDEISENNMETYFTKKSGFVFLHALTLDGITTQNNDVNSLYEIQERHIHTEQVDAKGTLNFMSRRPFSDMWTDIREGNDDFWMLYSNSMRRNKVFANKFFHYQEAETVEWAESMSPNYAEEFFAGEGKQDLSALMDCFTEGFLFKCSQTINNPLPKLLKMGILTTAMIRNFDPGKVTVVTLDQSPKSPQQIFESYYPQSIQSIHQQPTLRYTFDLGSKKIYEQPSNYDTLSPPWFLDKDDAMGFLKKYDSYAIQGYGEAIIEIRNIKRALSKDREFLTAGSKLLLKDANELFEFLEKTSKEKVLSKKYRDDILKCVPQRKED